MYGLQACSSFFSMSVALLVSLTQIILRSWKLNADGSAGSVAGALCANHVPAYPCYILKPGHGMTHALKRMVSYDTPHALGCIATMLVATSTAEYPAEILGLTSHFLALSGWAETGVDCS